jgi:hypothetical protein
MRKFVIFQKDPPTTNQIEIAQTRGVELIHVDKISGYAEDDEDLETIVKQQDAEGAITDDACLACRFMALGFPVGSFQKGCVSMQWEPVKIQAVHLWVFESVKSKFANEMQT